MIINSVSFTASASKQLPTEDDCSCSAKPKHKYTFFSSPGLFSRTHIRPMKDDCFIRTNANDKPCVLERQGLFSRSYVRPTKDID